MLARAPLAFSLSLLLPALSSLQASGPGEVAALAAMWVVAFAWFVASSALVCVLRGSPPNKALQRTRE